MADSLFSSLKEMLDKRAVGAIAGSLGQPEQSVSRGMESSIAALLGGLATKAADPETLRKLLDSAPPGETWWGDIASGVSDPNSPLVASGKRLMGSLFGSREGAVVNEIGRDTGLGTGIASTLMATLAPLVVSFIGKRVRDGHLSMSELGSMLQREAGTIRNYLPAGLRDMFWPAAETSRVSPVVAQAVTRERHSNWLPALALAALGLGLIWLLGHGRRAPVAQVTPVPTGTANRAVPSGTFAERTLPNRTNLNIPPNGVEANLLAFVQNPNARVDNSTWFNFDRLLFDTGSATLRPASQEQINNIAAILAAYPNVHLEVAGFTDNVGSGASNMELARDRANAVVVALVNRGVPQDCLTAGAYGAQRPAATNATEEGRAQNRRVALRVTQK